MTVEIKVPSVGESISEGTLARWLKRDGDVVEADEPVFELDTEKATTEVAAPASGRLTITVPEGKTVPIGTVVGSIQEGVPAQEKPKASAPAQEKPATKPVGVPQAPSASPRGPKQETPPLSPSVRRLVEEKHVDVRSIKGSGPGGRITKEDVLAQVEKKPDAKAEVVEKDGKSGADGETPRSAKPPAVASPPTAPVQVRAGRSEKRERMSAIRQRIAARLVEAKSNAAILTTFNEADVSAVMELRSRYKETFLKKYGVGLGFMSFFVKACVEALHAFPVVNSRIDGDDIVSPNYCDVGVAVSTEKGLMVPVLRDADQMSFAAIEQRIAELAEKARQGKISVSDLQGGTFTITNGGVFGSLLSTPILNPPQSGILGMHTIQKRPVAVNDQVVIRPMMYLALSYDHRLVDGREAVQFLARVKECIEDPERMLLEV
jgi:2-oxoglutarate dehydrogenase E2 component (dihydrolipoamide succinyltransferase)